jgi:hypothetical protein
MSEFRRPSSLMAVLGGMAVLLTAMPAEAHVKWFCGYDVASPPRPLQVVMNSDFSLLAALTLAVLLIAGVLDRTRIGEVMLESMNRVTVLLRANSELLIRAVIGGFFIALWALGNIILTPELKTGAVWVPWLQLGLAACMISRATLPLAGAGIIGLYVYGVQQYCVFHLLDYPIFLGLAVYLILTGLNRQPFGYRPLDIVRWATAITLMWASVEKWAYPEWTYPLLAVHPEMTFGFNPHFYMQAAGLVEFGLAFTLACRPLMRRTSSVILLGMFVSAIFEFGKIDAIGHSPIIVVLLAVMADDHVPSRKEAFFVLPAYYLASLGLTVFAYYGVHYLNLIYNPTMT